MAKANNSIRSSASQPAQNSRNSADFTVQDSTKNMSRRKAESHMARPGRIDPYHSARILSWIDAGETVGPKTLTVLIDHFERLNCLERLEDSHLEEMPANIPDSSVIQSLKKCVSLYSAPPSKLDGGTWHKMICAYIAHEFNFHASGAFENLDQKAMWHECQEAAEKDFMEDGLEAEFAA